MVQNYDDGSIFDTVKVGMETGAAVGKCVTGFAGAVTGGLTGAVAGCLYWLVSLPFQLGKE